MTEVEPYRTGVAVERAISDAARRATTTGRDTNRLVREAILDRFLCRVFADEGETFVLKGGTGMLARIRPPVPHATSASPQRNAPSTRHRGTVVA